MTRKGRYKRGKLTLKQLRPILRRIPEEAVDQFATAVNDAKVKPLDINEMFLYCVATGSDDLMELITDPANDEWRLGPYIDLMWAYSQLREYYAEVKEAREAAANV